MRKKTFHTLREAEKVGNYAEMPMLPDDRQIQVYVSKNDKPQPFYLICAKDSLVAFISGSGSIHFAGTTVNNLAGTAGSFFYVPAGVPHRIMPSEPSVTLRYKHRPATLEGVAWYCDDCGAEIYREVWDTAAAIEQDKYHEIASRFAAEPALRKCSKCGSVHPSPDISHLNWSEVAKQIAADRQTS
jgi:3-hydroxyanthranilate 3,4-dioxygenase